MHISVNLGANWIQPSNSVKSCSLLKYVWPPGIKGLGFKLTLIRERFGVYEKFYLFLATCDRNLEFFLVAQCSFSVAYKQRRKKSIKISIW